MRKNFLTYDEHSAFNEIVFENRNKEYGAYALRAEANATLQKAFLVGMAFFAVLAATPLVLAKLSPKPDVITTSGPFIIEEVDEPEDTPIKKDPIVVSPKPDVPVKTQSLDPPNPTANPTVETTIDPKVNDAVISTTTSPGKSVDNPNAHVDNTPKTDGGKIDTTPKIDANAIPAKVDVEADFLGGINAFRNKVNENFDTSSVESESGEVIKGIITFVVETDGTISNVKVNGANADFNKEAEKTIKKIKGKWNPAKLQGEKVRSYFRLPISMQFE